MQIEIKKGGENPALFYSIQIEVYGLNLIDRPPPINHSFLFLVKS